MGHGREGEGTRQVGASSCRAPSCSVPKGQEGTRHVYFAVLCPSLPFRGMASRNKKGHVKVKVRGKQGHVYTCPYLFLLAVPLHRRCGAKRGTARQSTCDANLRLARKGVRCRARRGVLPIYFVNLHTRTCDTNRRLTRHGVVPIYDWQSTRAPHLLAVPLYRK